MSQEKTSLHIACAIDDAFTFPLSVMLISVFENNRKRNVMVHLFSASLSEKYILLFKGLIEKYDQSFAFYRLNESTFEGLHISYQYQMSYAPYYRILIPENIDPSVETFLYLDADIIVLGDLTPLFNIDLKDKMFGAVHDICAIDCNMHIKHHIPRQYRYFNSGVLLINRNRWINLDATRKVLDYLNKHHQICDYLDQDGLNGSLYNERYPLPPMWNSQIGLHFIAPALLKSVYNNDYLLAIERPVIVHFNGREKPWHYVSAHPFKKQFNQYASKVKDFEYYSKPSINKIIKRILYSILGWKRLRRYYYYKTKTGVI
jgi:lipopolysaccharide biosynthesis glycosyltransferase